MSDPVSVPPESDERQMVFGAWMDGADGPELIDLFWDERDAEAAAEAYPFAAYVSEHSPVGTAPSEPRAERDRYRNALKRIAEGEPQAFDNPLLPARIYRLLAREALSVLATQEEKSA